MTRYKHALADPDYLLHVVAHNIDVTADEDVRSGAKHVCDAAKKSDSAQYAEAAKLAKLIISAPPRFDSQSAVREYVTTSVLSRIPKPWRFSDVFWSCFLTILDESGVPECAFGGPITHVVYEIYDDFDPGDVTL
jgi:hypothetical protein